MQRAWGVALCSANLCVTSSPPRPPPSIFPELSIRLRRSYIFSFSDPAKERRGGSGGDGWRLQSRCSASRRLLASCYFCVPVNRVWNPICLFATASELHLPQPCVISPSVLRTHTPLHDRCKSVCSSAVRIYVCAHM